MDRLSASKLIQLALADLPKHQRETLWLCFWDGYTLLEIGKRRKERLGNTWDHFYRGIENLRRAIAASEPTARREGNDQSLTEQSRLVPTSYAVGKQQPQKPL